MRVFKAILSVLLILSLFSGCTGQINLKDLSIVEGMGIDGGTENTDLTLQILNLAKEGTGAESLSGNITMTASSQGKNISYALTMMKKKLSKEVFLGQNKIVVFGKEVAEKGFENHLDYLLRSTDSRMDVLVCVSETEAKDVLESKENDALVPADSVRNLLENGEDNGFGAVVTVNDVLKSYANKTTDIYLPVLKADEESVSVSGIGLFNENKMVYVTNDDESFGFLTIMDKIESGIVEIANDELGEIGLEIMKSSADCSVTVKEGNIIFHVKVKTAFVLNEVEKGLTTELSDTKIEQIQYLAQDKIQEMCERAFLACIANGSDALRIGEYLCKYDSGLYNSIQDNWKEYLPSVSCNIRSDAVIEKVNDNFALE